MLDRGPTFFGPVKVADDFKYGVQYADYNNLYIFEADNMTEYFNLTRVCINRGLDWLNISEEDLDILIYEELLIKK